MNGLQHIIDTAKRIAFFGGAGVSTASGIPDFRSAGGLYAREYDGLTAEMILSHSFFCLHPDVFFSFYKKYMVHPDARPNAAHMKLAELERAGRLAALITQNIDGLHRAAGSRLVYELHGSVHENRCIECGRPYPLEYVMNADGVPKCADCGGIVKPEVTLYGEAPDHLVMTGACREIARADTLIVAGTSLTVEPAASCIAYFSGKNLVVINREETSADSRASLVLNGNVADIMGEIVTPPPIAQMPRRTGPFWRAD